MEERPNILKASILSGIFVGVLSGLPLIGLVNICFCLWVILGGILSSYILSSGYPHPVKSGDHAVSGLLTGVFGAIISFFLSIPFTAISARYISRIFEALYGAYGEGLPPGIEELLKQKEFTIAFIPIYLVGLVISLIVYGIFGALGGLIGSAIFKKQEEKTQNQ
ncbi:MAG: hypothetical protein ACUVUG_06565 [Candidatus Aminicenantia bacterium]